MLSSLDVWICECSLFHFRCYQLCRCVGTGAQIPRKRICNVSFKNSEAVGFFYSDTETEMKRKWVLDRKRELFVFCSPNVPIASRKRESVGLVGF